MIRDEFALLAPSERSSNQAAKLNAYNSHFQCTPPLQSLPNSITCQLLNIPFPTKDVCGAHIFQKRWQKHKSLIQLDDINNPKNFIFLFKPFELLFDEGSIAFIWEHTSNSFKLKVLNINLLSKTVLQIGILFYANSI